MPNGEIIETLQNRIRVELAKKRLSMRDRLILEVMELQLVYLHEDHVKVTSMWETYRPLQRWSTVVFTAILTAIIGFLFSR